MCGRLSVAMTPTELARAFPEAGDPDALGALDLPRYNVAPTRPVPALVAGDGAEGDGPPRWAALEWWLTPRWAKERTRRFATFNARAEDVASKPAFRASFRDRRCLVVGTSFFEWKREGEAKQPYAVGLADGSPLAFAGVWDRWVDRATGEVVESCAVVTTEPNALMAGIHDRMPVVVGPEERDVWLYGTADEARHVLRPYDPGAMAAWPVAAAVGNVSTEGPGCVAPIGA